jgi:hypothetical protein
MLLGNVSVYNDITKELPVILPLKMCNVLK